MGLIKMKSNLLPFLRLPDLIRELTMKAAEEGISLNRLISAKLSRA